MPFIDKSKLCFDSIESGLFLFSFGDPDPAGLSLVKPTGKECSPIPFWEFYRMKQIPPLLFSQEKSFRKP